MGRRRPQNNGPLGPGVIGGPLVRRLSQQFQLVHHFGALTVGRAQTVGAGVASAQDDHPFALGVDPFIVGYLFARLHPVLLGEILHGLVDSLQIPSRNVQFPRLGGTAGQADRVEFREQPVRREIDADVGVGQEGDAFFGHQVDAALDHALFQLEFGDAQGKKTADVSVPLDNRHQMPSAVQLLGGGQAGRAGPDHGYRFAGPHGGRLGLDPAVLKPTLGDLFLDEFDGHRVGIYAQDATGLTGSGANAAGELREIVGGKEGRQGPFPIAFIYLVIEIRDDVAQRAAHVAEGHGAVHAPGALLPRLGLAPGLVEFAVVALSLRRRTPLRGLPAGFHEACRFTHCRPLPAPAPYPPQPCSSALPTPGGNLWA